MQINVRRVRILYNPMSGAKKGEAFAKESEAVLKSNGIEVRDVYKSKTSG